MRISEIIDSSIGKKVLLGITGLSWVAFAIGHFIGNTTLLIQDSDPFNKYAHFLISLGTLIYLVEAVLAASLLIHMFYAAKVTYENFRARPTSYKKNKRVKGASKRGFATASMIYTGVLLIVFLVIHINNFKYGSYYTTIIDGEEVRDLYRTVYEYYASLGNVIYYVIMMTLLGTHLSHGVWSAFQSLGLNGKRFTPFIYKVGFIVAVILSIGYIWIPIQVHLAGGAA